MKKGDIFIKKDLTSLRLFEHNPYSLVHTFIDDKTLEMYKIPELEIIQYIYYGDLLNLSTI